MLRRRFIQGISLIVAWSTLTIAKAYAGLDRSVFAIGAFADKWAQITQGQSIEETTEIVLMLPAIAENGAVVPIVMRSALADLQQVLILVEKNPTPLAASFQLSPFVELTIHARIKMAESCNVHLLARQGNRWLHCQQWVKVMVGGCGTG